MERSSIDVTLFLKRYSSGDENALAELIPQIYDEHRRLASCYLQRERVDHTLQTTVLVREAYFRLVDQRKLNGTTATTSSGSRHKDAPHSCGSRSQTPCLQTRSHPVAISPIAFRTKVRRFG
ncbi:MAG: hypothetical protein DMG80_07795 [Acidobacteria bacterium]|nr:MAG: hypothetical protein DMG80_07795 [Acidobacteriota bacterium]